MNIHLENVKLSSRSGPNSFANKVVKYGALNGISFESTEKPDCHLCFIETPKLSFDFPLFQRLDGIYFNTRSNYNLQNANIRRIYEMADGVIFQSHFNRELITTFFGQHKNWKIIHNGADLEEISATLPIRSGLLDSYKNIWVCASHWRPHKRLRDNIRYFLEHSGAKDCLVVAGANPGYTGTHERVYFVGELAHNELVSLYKRANYFIHLAWLDHCPNVVIDARASGCQIICSTSGGTKEIAGPDAILIEEEEWDFQPLDLYNPPKLDFSRKVQNVFASPIGMNHCIGEYKKFMKG